MSENIPFEIQTEIMKTLPVKSLLRFRSVSKTWKSLIDSSDFIAQYSHQQTKPHHLLVRYKDYSFFHPNFDWNHISMDDNNDTFPQLKVSMTLPRSFTYHDLIGSSHGLLCLHRDDIVVLWNISIRKGVSIAVPNVMTRDGMHTTALGFGICRATRELKIVKFRCKTIITLDDVESIPWQVEVFTLSTRGWRSSCGNLSRKLVHFDSFHVAIDGFVYWLAYDRIAMDGGYCNMIISFDITTEEFKEVNLPDSLAQLPLHNLSLSKLRESLVVLERDVHGNNHVFNVWMMEDGVSNSFKMLFNVNVNAPYASIVGFRKSGVPIIEVSKQEHARARHVVYGPYSMRENVRARLVVYEPYSKRIDNLEIVGLEVSFSVYPYVETLLLLDQPDLTDNI